MNQIKHIKSSYTIGIIIESNGVTRKQQLISCIIDYVISKEYRNFQKLHILIAIRNSYEYSLAQQLISYKILHHNLYVELLITENQENRLKKNANCNTFSIINTADCYNTIHITFPTDLYRKLVHYMAQKCDKILYEINYPWQIKLLYSVADHNNIPTISISSEL